MNYYAAADAEQPVSGLHVDARAQFIVRTYAHLFGALALFTAIEVALFQSGLAERLASAMLGTSWLLVLGLFMLVSWLGRHFASSSKSRAVQYAALLGFVLAQAIVFVPMLWLANHYVPGAISNAAVISAAGFAGLTFIAFWTRKDFSFLGAILRWVGMCAVLGMVASLIFGFSMGNWFSVAMIVFAGGAILHDTSNVLHHYPEDRYVGAALELFASVALLFWYVLRLLMASRD